MDEKCIDSFIDFGHKQLSLIEQRDGEVIYSSKETFKKGKYYFLGLNPGGEGFVSIKKHLEDFSTWTKNSICDLKWNTSNHEYAEGQSPLQLRMQYLFNNVLKSDIRDVFSTNLIFETTKSADTLNFGLAGLCWSVHESALSVIQPEVIITCGNDQEKSAFSFIADLYCGKIEQKFLSGTFTIKYSKIIIQSRTTLLIGLPHLSRFEIRDNEDFKRKLLSILEENNG